MTFHELFYIKLFSYVNLSQFFQHLHWDKSYFKDPFAPGKNNAKKWFFSWSGGFSLGITRLAFSTNPKVHITICWTYTRLHEFPLGIHCHFCKTPKDNECIL